MKHVISGLLFVIILLTYIVVQKYTAQFMGLAWLAGYYKQYFEKDVDK